jgi:hypothetical protein
MTLAEFSAQPVDDLENLGDYAQTNP